MGQLHLCHLQLNYNYISFYNYSYKQLQLSRLQVQNYNCFQLLVKIDRESVTHFSITARRHWYIYCIGFVQRVFCYTVTSRKCFNAQFVFNLGHLKYF